MACEKELELLNEARETYEDMCDQLDSMVADYHGAVGDRKATEMGCYGAAFGNPLSWPFTLSRCLWEIDRKEEAEDHAYNELSAAIAAYKEALNILRDSEVKYCACVNDEED